MVRGKTVIVAIAALGSAVGAVLAMRHQQKASMLLTKPEPTMSVVILAHDIPRGHRLRRVDLKQQRWPTSLVPPGTLQEIEQVENRTTLLPLSKGELIFERKLAVMGAPAGIAALIPPGMRAYTVQAQRVTTNLAGFVSPGNFVDVLLSCRAQPGEGMISGSSRVLLPAVEVLAVGQRSGQMEADERTARPTDSITLLVRPEQAAKLDLGQSLGMISLTLRNSSDRDQSPLPCLTVADLASPSTVESITGGAPRSPDAEADDHHQLSDSPFSEDQPAATARSVNRTTISRPPQLHFYRGQQLTLVDLPP